MRAGTERNTGLRPERRQGLQSGLEVGMGRAGKPWAAAAAGLRAEKKEEKKIILFFFGFFFKTNSECNFNSIQNPTSTKKFKIVCSGMYAHSWLILYLTFSFKSQAFGPKRRRRRFFFSFLDFSSKQIPKCKFHSIQNPTSNQAIQNSMQWHVCTFMVDFIFDF